MSEAASVVIGGGLAGSAFAIELARRGRRVIVLEKTAGQHHKVCGEFLSAEAQDLLARLGLDVWTMGAAPATHLSLEFGDYRAKFRLPFRGAGLSRFRLDQALLDVAVQAGADVRRGVPVKRLDWKDGPAVVHTADESLRAAQVVLASGKHNVRGVSRPSASTVAFKMQMRIGPSAAAMLDQLVHLSMFANGYAGVCLIEDGIATICWVVDHNRLDGVATWEWQAHADFLSRAASFFALLLKDATPLWNRPVAVAAIPYGFIRKAVISESIYPVGDQLVVIPSYTGDGTSLALHTGLRAAQAVLQKRTAAEFQATAVAKLRPQIAWAKLANVAFVNARAQRISAAVARAMPWALPQLAALVTNKTRLRM